MPRGNDPEQEIARLLSEVRAAAQSGDRDAALRARQEIYRRVRVISRARIVAASGRSTAAANSAVRLENWALGVLREASDLIATVQ